VIGTPTVSNVNVKDSYACGGVSITATASADGGNNSCWSFGGIVIVTGGGYGGGADIGGPPPAGQGTVSGGSGGGGQTIGNDPGFFAPSANASASGWATGWTNPGNAYVSDDVYTTSNVTAATDFYNFGFNIPSTDTITGVAVKIEASASVAGHGSLPVELSWNSGSATTTAGLTTSGLVTTDTVYTLGGPTTLWGRSWVPSEFADGTFRVRIFMLNPSSTFNVDAIQVNVYHQASGGSSGGGEDI
jgi:hypothetical protein